MNIKNPEEKVKEIVGPVVHNLGFSIVSVSLTSFFGKGKNLEIAIEHLNGQCPTVDECGSVSKVISVVLNVEGFCRDRYCLLVSSPGVERSLYAIKDYVRFINRLAKFEFYNSIEVCNNSGMKNSLRKVEGMIHDVVDKTVVIGYNNMMLNIDFDNIKSAKLVFTNEMFRGPLKKK